MAARKINRAPPPPVQQQSPLIALQPAQQSHRTDVDEMVSVMSFGVESSSSGGEVGSQGATSMATSDVRLRRNSQGSGGSLSERPISSTAVTVGQPHEYKSHQNALMCLKRTAYIPNKSVAPQPPALQRQQLPNQLLPSVPHSLALSPQSKAVIMHQTVYTRPKQGDKIAYPPNGNRMSNPFSPTQRPISQQQSLAGSISGSIGNLSVASRRSSGSRKSLQNLGLPDGKHNDTSVKGRLTNLFGRKNRKQIPRELQERQKPQQYFSQQVLMRQADSQQRRYSQPVPQQQSLASRKNLHTFTYTDAKIYNPRNAEVYLGSNRRSKGPAPLPPSSAVSLTEATPPAQVVDNAGHTQVWWNMHTMGAMHSNYNTDVLLVRNPDPAPDYETSTTRF